MAQFEQSELNTSSPNPERLVPSAPPANQQPHWLLASWYGRDLLKVVLRKLHPELAVPMWQHASEMDDQLETIVDELELRDWQKPRTTLERVRYVFTVAKLYPMIKGQVKTGNSVDHAFLSPGALRPIGLTEEEACRLGRCMALRLVCASSPRPLSWCSHQKLLCPCRS